MGPDQSSVDQLYLIAESLAQDFSLFPQKDSSAVIDGLLNDKQIEAEVERLRSMDVDAYIAATVSPGEEASRPGAKEIIRSLGVPVFNEKQEGPYYASEIELVIDGATRRIGFSLTVSLRWAADQ